MTLFDRRRFLATSSLALVAAALEDVALFAHQAPATSFQDLRRGVGIFNGAGGTIGWLVSKDGILVVDSQMPAAAQACIDGLKQKSTRAIDVLVNTHHHGDHTGGNKTFRPVVKTIVSHATCDALYRKTAAAQNAEDGQAFADTTFTEAWKTTLGDETVSAKYYGAAHTSGDVVVTFERANVAHMGDLMFHKLNPFIDRASGASIANWISTLGLVVADHDAETVYVFGHAGPGLPATGPAAALVGLRDYFSAVLDHTRAQIKAGKTREEVTTSVAALPGFEDYAAPSPMLSLTAVLGTAYDELTS